MTYREEYLWPYFSPERMRSIVYTNLQTQTFEIPPEPLIGMEPFFNFTISLWIVYSCQNWYVLIFQYMIIEFTIPISPFSSLLWAIQLHGYMINSINGHTTVVFQLSITLMVFSVLIFSNSPSTRIFLEASHLES